MKKQIEIDDTLQELVDGATEQLKDWLLEHLEDNPDTTSTPCMRNDLDNCGTVHEIIDGAVPIYYWEIDTIHFLHGNRVEEAYENSGIGDKTEENYKAIAIYCFIEQEVAEWYEENAEGIFDEWQLAAWTKEQKKPGGSLAPDETPNATP